MAVCCSCYYGHQFASSIDLFLGITTITIMVPCPIKDEGDFFPKKIFSWEGQIFWASLWGGCSRWGTNDQIMARWGGKKISEMHFPVT